MLAPLELLAQFQRDEDQRDDRGRDHRPEDYLTRRQVTDAERVGPGRLEAEQRESLPEEEPQQWAEGDPDSVRREVPRLREEDPEHDRENQEDHDGGLTAGRCGHVIPDIVREPFAAIENLAPENYEKNEGGDERYCDHQTAQNLRPAAFTIGHDPAPCCRVLLIIWRPPSMRMATSGAHCSPVRPNVGIVGFAGKVGIAAKLCGVQTSISGAGPISGPQIMA